jgi:tRNA(fMet)-specific endonuclease VapC
VIERLAVDANAVIDYIRLDREYSPELDDVEKTIFIPLTVIGELFYGASRTQRPDHHRAVIERLIRRWQPLLPDLDTARFYGTVRGDASRSPVSLSASKTNDLWIAALCIQHNLPLLTNDGGFDNIAGLTVIHW